jgi:hypothetical protein
MVYHGLSSCLPRPKKKTYALSANPAFSHTTRKMDKIDMIGYINSIVFPQIEQPNDR